MMDGDVARESSPNDDFEIIGDDGQNTSGGGGVAVSVEVGVVANGNEGPISKRPVDEEFSKPAMNGDEGLIGNGIEEEQIEHTRIENGKDLDDAPKASAEDLMNEFGITLDSGVQDDETDGNADQSSSTGNLIEEDEVAVTSSKTEEASITLDLLSKDKSGDADGQVGVSLEVGLNGQEKADEPVSDDTQQDIPEDIPKDIIQTEQGDETPSEEALKDTPEVETTQDSAVDVSMDNSQDTSLDISQDASLDITSDKATEDKREEDDQEGEAEAGEEQSLHACLEKPPLSGEELSEGSDQANPKEVEEEAGESKEEEGTQSESPQPSVEGEAAAVDEQAQDEENTAQEAEDTPDAEEPAQTGAEVVATPEQAPEEDAAHLDREDETLEQKPETEATDAVDDEREEGPEEAPQNEEKTKEDEQSVEEVTEAPKPTLEDVQDTPEEEETAKDEGDAEDATQGEDIREDAGEKEEPAVDEEESSPQEAMPSEEQQEVLDKDDAEDDEPSKEDSQDSQEVPDVAVTAASDEQEDAPVHEEERKENVEEEEDDDEDEVKPHGSPAKLVEEFGLKLDSDGEDVQETEGSADHSDAEMVDEEAVVPTRLKAGKAGVKLDVLTAADENEPVDDGSTQAETEYTTETDGVNMESNKGDTLEAGASDAVDIEQEESSDQQQDEKEAVEEPSDEEAAEETQEAPKDIVEDTEQTDVKEVAEESADIEMSEQITLEEQVIEETLEKEIEVEVESSPQVEEESTPAPVETEQNEEVEVESSPQAEEESMPAPVEMDQVEKVTEVEVESSPQVEEESMPAPVETDQVEEVNKEVEVESSPQAEEESTPAPVETDQVEEVNEEVEAKEGVEEEGSPVESKEEEEPSGEQETIAETEERDGTDQTEKVSQEEIQQEEASPEEEKEEQSESPVDTSEQAVEEEVPKEPEEGSQESLSSDQQELEVKVTQEVEVEEQTSQKEEESKYEEEDNQQEAPSEEQEPETACQNDVESKEEEVSAQEAPSEEKAPEVPAEDTPEEPETSVDNEEVSKEEAEVSQQEAPLGEEKIPEVPVEDTPKPPEEVVHNGVHEEVVKGDHLPEDNQDKSKDEEPRKVGSVAGIYNPNAPKNDGFRPPLTRSRSSKLDTSKLSRFETGSAHSSDSEGGSISSKRHTISGTGRLNMARFSAFEQKGSVDGTDSASAPAGIKRGTGTRSKSLKYGSAAVHSELCHFCQKRVYPMEKITADTLNYHKNCFRCSVCKNPVKLGNYSALNGVLYCKPHFKQSFRVKGNYNFTPQEGQKANGVTDMNDTTDSVNMDRSMDGYNIDGSLLDESPRLAESPISPTQNAVVESSPPQVVKSSDIPVEPMSPEGGTGSVKARFESGTVHDAPAERGVSENVPIERDDVVHSNKPADEVKVVKGGIGNLKSMFEKGGVTNVEAKTSPREPVSVGLLEDFQASGPGHVSESTPVVRDDVIRSTDNFEDPGIKQGFSKSLKNRFEKERISNIEEKPKEKIEITVSEERRVYQPPTVERREDIVNAQSQAEDPGIKSGQARSLRSLFEKGNVSNVAEKPKPNLEREPKALEDFHSDSNVSESTPIVKDDVVRESTPRDEPMRPSESTKSMKQRWETGQVEHVPEKPKPALERQPGSLDNYSMSMVVSENTPEERDDVVKSSSNNDEFLASKGIHVGAGSVKAKWETGEVYNADVTVENNDKNSIPSKITDSYEEEQPNGIVGQENGVNGEEVEDEAENEVVDASWEIKQARAAAMADLEDDDE